MNVYSTGSSQNHCIVAESMKIAAELYEKEYGEEPKELTLISEYVIVQKQEDS